MVGVESSPIVALSTTQHNIDSMITHIIQVNATLKMRFCLTDCLMYTRLTRLTSPVVTTVFFGPRFAVDYSPVWYSFSAFPRKIKPRVTGQMLVEKKPFDYWRIYPVVVFSGKLWEATFAADGELDVAPLKWATYLHMYKGNPHPVDVVSFSYLEDYLDSIGSEIVLLQKVRSGTQ